MLSVQAQVVLPEGDDRTHITLIQESDEGKRNVVVLSSEQFEAATKLVHAVYQRHDPLANWADEFLFNIPGDDE